MNHALHPKNIVIATFIGSLGDLHPCLALGQELTTRGHRVTIATNPYYRDRVEGCGLFFHAMRPDWDPTDARMIRSCEDLKRGLEVLYRQILLPELKNTYRDLLTVTSDADLLITGELVYAAPLAAEKRGLPWVSLILSPFSFFSCIDPSYPVNLPILFSLRKAGPTVYKAVINLVKLATRHWSNPVPPKLRREERTAVGDMRSRRIQRQVSLRISSWRCSPRWFAPKQRDWPEQTLQPVQFLFHRSNSPDAPNVSTGWTSFFSAREGLLCLFLAQGSHGSSTIRERLLFRRSGR